MIRKAILTLALFLVPSLAPAADAPPKKIVLIAGTKSHGPGEHEYEKGARLLAHCINTSPNLKGFKGEVFTDGWPKDERISSLAGTHGPRGRLSDGSFTFRQRCRGRCARAS